MIRIAGLRVPLTYTEESLRRTAAERMRIDAGRIRALSVASRAIDASDREDICFSVTLDTDVFGSETDIVWTLKDKKVTIWSGEPYQSCAPGGPRLPERPVVVGCGPAGMFAALLLAEAGECPILLERGQDVDARLRSVTKFWESGELDPESNVQFGAGGAGTFSDGKLKVGKPDPRKMKILSEFVAAGAPPEILYDKMPHIGTDRLHTAVRTLVAKITRLGGEVRFGAAVTEILRKDGRVTGVGFVRDGIYSEIPAGRVILAVGHSARDTFSRLRSGGIVMEQKPFSVGVRIEHPQALIDRIQYGRFAGDPRLGAAPYRMVVHLPDGRNVYTFCMCPGGSVVAATSEKGRLVTNGMSEWKRGGPNANAAVLVTVDPKDLGSDDPLAGIAFQRKIEEAAFAAGGGGYRAPSQRLEDFLADRETAAFGDVCPTYRPGTGFSRVESYLPEDLAGALRRGLLAFGEWMPGYLYPDAILTGAETRSTSPVRMVRGATLEAEGVRGLYPCGEGAGYAGGIISAAVDGMLCAERILENA